MGIPPITVKTKTPIKVVVPPHFVNEVMVWQHTLVRMTLDSKGVMIKSDVVQGYSTPIKGRRKKVKKVVKNDTMAL